jgi:N6-L-threonylcarbamoyladenine synthase
MIALGIETSCDETGAAIVKDGRILSNILSSSVSLHEKYGGVIPEIASRFHVEYINKVTKRALLKAGKKLKDLDIVAVTEEPGLPGSLITGRSFAAALSYSLGIPLVNVNHLFAHLYANFLVNRRESINFPFIGIVVSGGHTNIFICRTLRDIEVIGRTRDDAVGEAFDKVAKVLGIGYPGGPRIEKCAKMAIFGKKGTVDFPRAYLDKDSFDFSLSGIKTAVFYYVKNRKISRWDIAGISRSFQESVFDVLAERVVRAAKKHRITEVLAGGGVISNARLREKLKVVCEKASLRLYYPPPALCVDNAAMVAGLGEALYRN